MGTPDMKGLWSFIIVIALTCCLVGGCIGACSLKLAQTYQIKVEKQ